MLTILPNSIYCKIFPIKLKYHEVIIINNPKIAIGNSVVLVSEHVCADLVHCCNNTHWELKILDKLQFNANWSDDG